MVYIYLSIESTLQYLNREFVSLYYEDSKLIITYKYRSISAVDYMGGFDDFSLVIVGIIL